MMYEKEMRVESIALCKSKYIWLKKSVKDSGPLVAKHNLGDCHFSTRDNFLGL